eukprot:3077445-Prymnesium_polylepis.1
MAALRSAWATSSLNCRRRAPTSDSRARHERGPASGCRTREGRATAKRPQREVVQGALAGRARFRTSARRARRAGARGSNRAHASHLGLRLAQLVPEHRHVVPRAALERPRRGESMERRGALAGRAPRRLQRRRASLGRAVCEAGADERCPRRPVAQRARAAALNSNVGWGAWSSGLSIRCTRAWSGAPFERGVGGVDADDRVPPGSNATHSRQ